MALSLLHPLVAVVVGQRMDSAVDGVVRRIGVEVPVAVVAEGLAEQGNPPIVSLLRALRSPLVRKAPGTRPKILLARAGISRIKAARLLQMHRGKW